LVKRIAEKWQTVHILITSYPQLLELKKNFDLYGQLHSHMRFGPPSCRPGLIPRGQPRGNDVESTSPSGCCSDNKSSRLSLPARACGFGRIVAAIFQAAVYGAMCKLSFLVVQVEKFRPVRLESTELDGIHVFTGHADVIDDSMRRRVLPDPQQCQKEML
jgi:hypothetical protein